MIILLYSLWQSDEKKCLKYYTIKNKAKVADIAIKLVKAQEGVL
jgi:hypothetical protein